MENFQSLTRITTKKGLVAKATQIKKSNVTKDKKNLSLLSYFK